MADKLGPYINTLMTTVLDKEQEEFVQDLAWNELKRINADIEEFLRKHTKDDSEDQSLSYIPKPESFMWMFGRFANAERPSLHNLRPDLVWS